MDTYEKRYQNALKREQDNHQKEVSAIAWNQINATYDSLSYEEKAKVRRLFNTYELAKIFEQNNHYVRAAIYEGQLINNIRNTFGTAVCDTLVQYYQLGYFLKDTSDTTKIINLVGASLRSAFFNHSNIYYRDGVKELKKAYQNLMLDELPKQFNALEAQPVIDAHKYNKRFSYLAARDDSLTLLIKQRKFQKAWELANRLLKEKEHTIGKKHPAYALTLSDMAWISLNTNEKNRKERDSLYVQALRLQTEAMNIYKKARQPLSYQLSTKFLSDIYYHRIHWAKDTLPTIYSTKQINSLIQQKQEELDITQTVLGDSAIEVLAGKIELDELVKYDSIQYALRHEDHYRSEFQEAVALYHQGKNKEALQKFSSINEKEKYEYLPIRRNYTYQWMAACYLQLGDTTAASRNYYYYVLPPIDRSKTLELDYLCSFEPDNPKFLSIARDTLGDETIDFAHMLLLASATIVSRINNLPNRIKNERYKLAANYLQTARSIIKKNGIDNKQLNTEILINQGNIYYSIHYYKEAVAVLDEALPLIAQTRGKNTRSYENALNQMINACAELNDYSRVAQWKEEQLQLDFSNQKKSKYESLEDIAKNLINQYKKNSGDTASLTHAIELLHQAIGLRTEQLNRVCQYGLNHENLDSIQFYFWRRAAIDLYDKAPLMECHFLLGQKKEAYYYYEKCVDILSLIYVYIALEYFKAGELQLCEETAREASRLRDEYRRKAMYHGLTSHTYNKVIANNRDYVANYLWGSSLSLTKQYEKSVPILKKAMRMREEVQGVRDANYYAAMRPLIISLSKTKHFDEAAACAAESWQYFSDDCLKQLAVSNVSQREQYWNEQKSYFEQIMPRLFSDITHPSVPGIFYDNTLLCKGLLLNTEMEIGRLINDSGDAHQKALYQQLRESQLLLTSEMLKPEQQKILDTDSLQTIIISQENALLGTLQQEKSSEIVKGLRSSWRDVQKQLSVDDIAIEFMTIPISKDNSDFFALTLRKGYDYPHLIKLFSMNDLRLIDKSDYYKTSRLFDILWRPLLDELKEAKNIYFSPVSSLHQIGIEYLPGMELYNVYRLSSTRELVAQKKNRGNLSLNATLYGGLKFELTSTERNAIQKEQTKPSQTFRDIPDLASLRDLRGSVRHMPVLEGSQKEVVDIDSLMRRRKINVTTLVGTDGTEESFKALSGQHKSIIHISTHGFYQPEEQKIFSDNDLSSYMTLLGESDKHVQTQEDHSLSRSGLLMTGSADYIFGRINGLDMDDGILTAREISRMDLSGLDLVVLSACETGLGDISGEGVFGLQRGFKKAGAQTLLVSLWKVEDDATQLLMTAFYRNLLSGQTKRQAFFNAQQELRKAEGGRFNRYECWAAFVMIDGLK